MTPALPAVLARLALAAADAVPAAPAAAASAAARPLDLGAGTGTSLGGAVAAVTLLAALAVAAVLLSRRRRIAGRHVEVLETTSLGPRRALVVARVGGELLLLASSEAGISVLPARLEARGAETPVRLAGSEAPLAAVDDEAAGFDALLHDSAEDQELRLKLARGLAGSVR